MTSLDTQVLIVGAGPAGLTLAGELHRHGVACRVIDRATEPSLQSRALVLHCATQKLLQDASLRDRIADKAIPIHGMRFSRGQRPLATIPFDLGRYPALSLPQPETEALMRAALGERGVFVDWALSSGKSTRAPIRWLPGWATAPSARSTWSVVTEPTARCAI